MLRSIYIPESRLEEFFLDLDNTEQILCPNCASAAILLDEQSGKLCCQNCLEVFDRNETELSKISWLKVLLEKACYSLQTDVLEAETLQQHLNQIIKELEILLDESEKESQSLQILDLLAQASALSALLFDLEGEDDLALKQAKRNLIYREQIIDLEASLKNLFFLALAHFDLGILSGLTEEFQAEAEINNGMSLLQIALSQAEIEEDMKQLDLFHQRAARQKKLAAGFYFDQKKSEKAAALIESALQETEQLLKKSRSSESILQQEKAGILSLGSDIYRDLNDFSKSGQMLQRALSLEKSLLEEKLLESFSDETEISEADGLNEVHDILETVRILYFKLAEHYKRADQKEKALEAAKEMEDFFHSKGFEKLKDYWNVGFYDYQMLLFYQLLAEIYQALDEMDKAQASYLKGLETLDQNQLYKSSEEELQTIFRFLDQLLDLYGKTGRIKKQEQLFDQIDQFTLNLESGRKDIKEATFAFWTFRQNCRKVSFYLYRKETEKASFYALAAQILFQKLPQEALSSEIRELAVNLFENQALILAWKKDFRQARECLNQAEQLRRVL